ncbi:MAG: DegT/DnrJ/EryC1/StrS family aminotransferase [Candidatus Omnitrophota bacterium]|nr:DegT/DnrJ/EryC1/StrS family aminotransferase [Candidatus Omnitrophota bacterium]
MIPVNEPLLGKKELDNVMDCVRSGWISSKGDYITKFEEEFARFCGLRYGISTTSGTTAIHLALAALDIKKGDEVIMPTFTMIATAYAVLYTGGKPVLVDCDDRTWNMDVSRIEKLINRRTKAILPVHIYGHPVDMDGVRALARKYGLYVVEDAAEAHGAEYKGVKCGALGDIGCFSFYGNKIITTGEGGMVVTNSKSLARKAGLLKDLAHSRGKRFLHTYLGFNYRMTNMQAAVGLAQTRQAAKLVRKKRWIAKAYHDRLKDVEGLTLPVEEEWAKNVYWMYSVVVEGAFGLSRDALMEELRKEGVDTRAFFVPMHRQPVLRAAGVLDRKAKYPVAERISRRGLYLPTGLTLEEKDIDFVCRKLKKTRKRSRNGRKN